MCQPVISLSPSSTKDKTSPQIPPEECQYVLCISSAFCLMFSSEGKVIFDCHRNTLNSSPVYSYTNYKDTVHHLQNFPFYLRFSCFYLLVFILLLFLINHESSNFSTVLGINCHHGAKKFLCKNSCVLLICQNFTFTLLLDPHKYPLQRIFFPFCR